MQDFFICEGFFSPFNSYYQKLTLSRNLQYIHVRSKSTFRGETSLALVAKIKVLFTLTNSPLSFCSVNHKELEFKLIMSNFNWLISVELEIKMFNSI